MNELFIPRPCRITAVRQQTAVESTFTIATDIRPSFGQFLEVSLPGAGEAPISVSGFGEGWIDLTIRAAGCLTKKILECRPGDRLWVRGPFGTSFPFEQFAGGRLVIIAGGSGVAPVASLIRHAIANPVTVSPLDLLLGFRNPEAILFREEIAQWKTACQTIVTVDEAGPGWDGEVGMVTRHVPRLLQRREGKLSVVIVGPPVMMKFTAAECLQQGVAAERIWVSFERRMSCGLGKCGHCKIDDVYVCVDGPVFNYVKAAHLID